MPVKIIFANMSNDFNSLNRQYLKVAINLSVVEWQDWKINEAAVTLL